MKRTLIAWFSLILCLMFAQGVQAGAREDIPLHKECKYCGMNRESFDFSRMLIEYDDGTTAAFCSIHCAAVDFAVNIGKTPKAIRVGDFTTKDLIDAEKAVWTVGGSKPGVMSKRGKWAFAKKEDAEAFIKQNGGSLADFETAMKAAYEDMYADTKMIRERRAAKKNHGNGSGHKH
jgi:nitrous oxide reductase accessory protein NosL